MLIRHCGDGSTLSRAVGRSLDTSRIGFGVGARTTFWLRIVSSNRLKTPGDDALQFARQLERATNARISTVRYRYLDDLTDVTMR